MHKEVIKQVQSSKGSIMNVDKLEDEMIYLYRLIHTCEESYEEDKETKEYALAVHNSERGKTSFKVNATIAERRFIEKLAAFSRKRKFLPREIPGE